MYLLDGNCRLSTRGVVYSLDKEKGIKSYVGAEFAGDWDQADADNEENLISRLGYVITHAGCTVLWCIKLQM